MREQFQHVDETLGLKAKSVSIVGDWGDGAEDSVLTENANFRDFAELQYAMAWKGKLADQKSVLLFQEQKEGPHHIYVFDVDDTIEGVRTVLSDAGVAFRSIALASEGKPRVYVVDLDGSLASGVSSVGEHYGTQVEYLRGKGAYVGVASDRPRQEARAEYDRIIADKTVMTVSKRRARVLVIDDHRDLEPLVQRLADLTHGKKSQFSGQAKFEGVGAKQPITDAIEIYREIAHAYEKKYPARPHIPWDTRRLAQGSSADANANAGRSIVAIAHRQESADA